MAALRPLLNLVSNRVAALPMAAVVLTQRCNSQCSACDFGLHGELHMDDTLVDRLLDELPRSGTRYVLLSGGEPMLHPRWAEVGKRLRADGIRVGMATNGLLVSKHVEALGNAVDELFISLDAADAALYRALRGVDAFAVVVKGMKAAKQGGVPVVARCTLQHGNVGQVGQILELGQEIDVPVSFLTVDTWSVEAFGRREGWSRDAAVRQEDVEVLKESVARAGARFGGEIEARVVGGERALREKVAWFEAVAADEDPIPPRCNTPRIGTVVETDGRLRPCYFLPAVGEVSERSLLETLNGLPAVAMREAQRRGERKECARCVCALYWGPRKVMGIAG